MPDTEDLPAAAGKRIKTESVFGATQSIVGIETNCLLGAAAKSKKKNKKKKAGAAKNGTTEEATTANGVDAHTSKTADDEDEEDEVQTVRQTSVKLFWRTTNMHL